MAKFVTFKNANPPYEGQPILINIDHIVSVYEDFAAKKKVMLWGKDNYWHVEDTIEEVYDKLGLEYKRNKKEIQ
tara:strand:+ start:51 stop:272 length:222 start_codon:yes stop_codon:yes gene_type:complete